MKINIPWRIRLPEVKTGSPRSGNRWNRKHSHESRSVPTRSVLMAADDLDHLGSLHHTAVEHDAKPKRFCRWF